MTAKDPREPLGFYADLHMHSNRSDGLLSPEALVERVAAAGVRVVSLTDHDTLDGVAAARAAGRTLGVEVIAGLEISAWHEREVHVLGYYVDEDHPRLLEMTGAQRTSRRARVEEIGRRLGALGIALDIDGVLASAHGNVGRPHVARALIAAGHVRTFSEAFQRFLRPGCPAFVPASRLSARDAIALIHEAGGVAVLAHPGVEQAETLIPALAADGLDGLECGHPAHDAPTEARLRQTAKQLGLIATAGSDFHHPGGSVDVGGRGCPPETLQALQARCARVGAA